MVLPEGEHDMSKTKEGLDALKEEVEAFNEKLAELTPEELAKVSGGGSIGVGGTTFPQTVVIMTGARVVMAGVDGPDEAR